MSPVSIVVQNSEDKLNDNEWGYEKSFDVIGWSKDGSRLLTAAVLAGGDWDETTPIIFDFETHKSWRVELAPVFRKFVRKGCLVYFRPVSLTSTGEAVIFVAPLEADNACF